MSIQNCVFCNKYEPDGTKAVNEALLRAQDQIFDTDIYLTVYLHDGQLVLEGGEGAVLSQISVHYCPACGRRL